MPEYKRQHYLPSAYLKHFSADAEPTRTSLVWRHDGQQSRQVSVQSQCAADYFYSKERPAEVERMFQDTERRYEQCIQKVKARQSSTVQDYFGLILIMVDLHLRSRAYFNDTGGEGIGAYASRFDAFKRGLLLGARYQNPTDSQVLQHLQRHWRVKVLECSSGDSFITSDHPAAWFGTSKGRQQIDLMMLPMTPRLTAISFDNRVVDVVGQYTTTKDAGRMNQCQVVQALECIYSSLDLSCEVKNMIRSQLKNKTRFKGKTDAQVWQASLLILPNIRDLSFLRSKPPLM